MTSGLAPLMTTSPQGWYVTDVASANGRGGARCARGVGFGCGEKGSILFAVF